MKGQHFLVHDAESCRLRWRHRRMVSDYSLAKSSNRKSPTPLAPGSFYALRQWREESFHLQHADQQLLLILPKRLISGSSTGVMTTKSRGVRTLNPVFRSAFIIW